MTIKVSKPFGFATAYAEDAAFITPADETDLAPAPRSLYVGTGGDLVVEMWAGGTVTFANVPDGTILPIMPRKVLTASSADDILGLY